MGQVQEEPVRRPDAAVMILVLRLFPCSHGAKSELSPRSSRINPTYPRLQTHKRSVVRVRGWEMRWVLEHMNKHSPPELFTLMMSSAALWGIALPSGVLGCHSRNAAIDSIPHSSAEKRNYFCYLGRTKSPLNTEQCKIAAKPVNHHVTCHSYPHRDKQTA